MRVMPFLAAFGLVVALAGPASAAQYRLADLYDRVCVRTDVKTDAIVAAALKEGFTEQPAQPEPEMETVRLFMATADDGGRWLIMTSTGSALSHSRKIVQGMVACNVIGPDPGDAGLATIRRQIGKADFGDEQTFAFTREGGSVRPFDQSDVEAETRALKGAGYYTLSSYTIGGGRLFTLIHVIERK